MYIYIYTYIVIFICIYIYIFTVHVCRDTCKKETRTLETENKENNRFPQSFNDLHALALRGVARAGDFDEEIQRCTGDFGVTIEMMQPLFALTHDPPPCSDHVCMHAPRHATAPPLPQSTSDRLCAAQDE